MNKIKKEEQIKKQLKKIERILEETIKQQSKIEETITILEKSLDKSTVDSPETGVICFFLKIINQYVDYKDTRFNLSLINHRVQIIKNILESNGETKENIIREIKEELDELENTDNLEIIQNLQKMLDFEKNMTDKPTTTLKEEHKTNFKKKPEEKNIPKTIDEKNTNNLSREELEKLKGDIIGKESNVHIRENVLKDVKANVDKGAEYIVEKVMKKYHPGTKRSSRATYARAYLNRLDKKQLSIPKQKKSKKQKTNKQPPSSSTKRTYIHGTRIVDDDAKYLEQKMGTKLVYERLTKILKSIAFHPDSTIKKISDYTEISYNNTMAHIKYASRKKQVDKKGNHVSLTQEGIDKLAELTEKFQAESKKTKTGYHKKMEGEYIMDKDGIDLYRKYGSPVIKERYNKIKNVLGNAWSFKSTIPELNTTLDKYAKQSILVQILYGERREEIVKCGKDDSGNIEYCLKKNVDKTKPDKVSKGSRMY